MLSFEFSNCGSAGVDVRSEEISVGDMLMFRGYTGERKYLAVVIGLVKSKLQTSKDQRFHKKICFLDENNHLRILITSSSFLEPLEK